MVILSALSHLKNAVSLSNAKNKAIRDEAKKEGESTRVRGQVSDGPFGMANS